MRSGDPLAGPSPLPHLPLRIRQALAAAERHRGAAGVGPGQPPPALVRAVGECCEQAEVADGDRVLDIGTGTGLQAAVLAQLGATVQTLECDPEALQRARSWVDALCLPIEWHLGDAFSALPRSGPYDAIVVGGAVQHVPDAWFEALAEGGRLVVPIGTDAHQELVVFTRQPWGLQRRRVGAVAYAPLIG